MEQRPIGIAAGMIRNRNQVGGDGLPYLVNHITFGSFTLNSKVGNKEPRYWFDQERQMSLNAIGLENDGLGKFLNEELPGLASSFAETGCAIAISLAPLKTGDLADMIGMIMGRPHLLRLIERIEVNAACPNHRDEQGGALHPVLAHDPVALEALMAEARGYPGAKSIKIAPRMGHDGLILCVEDCMRHGFSAIVSGNTLLSDAEGRLSVPKGGMAGAPLLEMAVEQVSALSAIIRSMNARVSIIGCGGIMSVEDVRRHLDAGATTVQVATYFYEYGTRGVRDLVAGLV